MFGVLIYDVLFFGIPVVLTVVFGIVLYRYCYAKKENKKNPGTFSDAEMRNRKIFLIIDCVITGAFLAVALGVIVLLFMAVAFM